MPTEKAHFVRIDALRGLAILAVFLFHYFLAVDQRSAALAQAAMLPTEWAPLLKLHTLGFLGVQLFFVISGFCIHYSYISWRKRNPGLATVRFFPGFYHRRFWRIVPPYLVALFVLYFAKTSAPFSAASMKELLTHVTLWNTLFVDQFFAINPSFWSVAVEWQLYLAYPLVLWLFLRWGSFGGFLAATLISVAFRFFAPLIEAPFWIQNLPFKWWYDWSIGVLVAVNWAEQRRLFPENRIFGVVFGLLAYAAVAQPEFISLRWAVPPLFFAYIVEASVFSQRRLSKVTSLFALLGLCSYSLYLWHQPLLHLAVSKAAIYARDLGPVTIWLWLCGILLVALTAWSQFAYHWVELPSIAMGHRSMEVLRRWKQQFSPPASAFAYMEAPPLKPISVVETKP